MIRSVWLWRWRHNPLRRRSYAVEAWALLAVGLLAAVAASFTAVSVGHDVNHRLVEQRAQRHPVTAVLTEDAPDADHAGEPRARVRWIAPDGTRLTGRAKVALGLERGSQVTVWTDDRGRLLSAPLGGRDAHLVAAVTGAAAAFGVCLLALTGWLLAAQLTDRRRAAQWAAEWRVIGPSWDRRTA